jgi:lysophospholipase L1-like esterase
MRILEKLGLALLATLAALAVGEAALRVGGYQFSPIVFLVPENDNDWRAFHIGAADPRLSARDPLTIFDDELLWTVNPRVSSEINAQGFRGEPIPEDKPANAYVIVAVGDSNTLGPLNARDHWPGFLQDLVALNRSRRSIQIVNAGVYGYTSFQGLRRFEQVARYPVDLVYFSFGANDAQPVRTSDAEYAARIDRWRRWQWLRSAPFVAQLTMNAMDEIRPSAPRTHRVPPADYRRNLERFVDEARARKIRPVLLTRPFVGSSRDPESWMTYAPEYNELTRQVAREKAADLVDIYEDLRDAPELYADPSHFNRLGNLRMAERLLKHLETVDVIETAEVASSYATTIDIGRADDRRRELGAGWWAPERRPNGLVGRWIEGEALLFLERRSDEAHLLIDLTNDVPTPLSVGRVEVNGVTVYEFHHRKGRHRRYLDIDRIPGTKITVRFVVAPTYVPRDHGANDKDQRALGVFVHSVGLLHGTIGPDVELGTAEDGQPELGPGWWEREVWPDGRTGRWTRGEASVVLERQAGERGLLVDLTLESPSNRTAGHIDVNGTRVDDFSGPNGRQTRLVDISGVPGGRIEVRFFANRGRIGHTNGQDPRLLEDPRGLGVFVHAVRLVPSATVSAK